MCEEWKKDFIIFRDWAYANGWAPGLQIDRINVNGNYEPSNCRWVNDLEQASNTRQIKNVTYNGKTQHHGAWARELNIDRRALSSMLSKVSVEEAFRILIERRDKKMQEQGLATNDL